MKSFVIFSHRLPLSFLCFRSKMSYNRYVLINRFLHLADNSQEPKRGEANFDPWYKIRPVLDHINRKFKKHFTAGRVVSIDESIVGMKNRTIYIQYIPNKRHNRFGIKKFEICDSKTGYVLHVVLYSGKDFDVRSDDGQGSAVVKHLLREAQLLGKGHHLVTDNFYTKVKLAEDLFAEKTLLTGTVRQSSKGFPKKLTSLRLQPQTARYAEKPPVLACAYRDKVTQQKPVFLLSTGSSAVNITESIRGKDKLKPHLVRNIYNPGMGGVDMSDRKIYQIAAERPTHRYWVKIFRNIMDMSLRNAYEIYLQTVTTPPISCQDFVAEVVEGLCTPAPQPEQPMSLSLQHQCVLLPDKKERDCVVCSDRSAGIRRRSRHWCPGCDVGVHGQCFVQLEHYRRGSKRKHM